MNIQVIADGKQFKVLVDQGMNGAFPYSSAAVANQEATRLKDKHYPQANLTLI